MFKENENQTKVTPASTTTTIFLTLSGFKFQWLIKRDDKWWMCKLEPESLGCHMRGLEGRQKNKLSQYAPGFICVKRLLSLRNTCPIQAWERVYTTSNFSLKVLVHTSVTTFFMHSVRCIWLIVRVLSFLLYSPHFNIFSTPTTLANRRLKYYIAFKMLFSHKGRFYIMCKPMNWVLLKSNPWLGNRTWQTALMALIAPERNTSTVICFIRKSRRR